MARVRVVVITVLLIFIMKPADTSSGTSTNVPATSATNPTTTPTASTPAASDPTASTPAQP